MKAGAHVIVSLQDLLNAEQRKIADVEKYIGENLQVWISKTESQLLKEELEHYLFDIRSHQKDLLIFEKDYGKQEKEYVSKVVFAYVGEINDNLGICADTKVADAYLIYAIQAINHYKINIYGTLAAYANSLGQMKMAGIYHKAMLDEKVADMRLSNIAERNVNMFAISTVYQT